MFPCFSSAYCRIGATQGHSVAVIGSLRGASPKLCTHQGFHLLIMFHCFLFFSNSSRNYEQKKTQSSEEGRQATGIRGTGRRKSAEDASERSSAPFSPEKQGDGNSRSPLLQASSLGLRQSPGMFRTEIVVSFGQSRRQFLPEAAWTCGITFPFGTLRRPGHRRPSGAKRDYK